MNEEETIRWEKEKGFLFMRRRFISDMQEGRGDLGDGDPWWYKGKEYDDDYD